MSEAGTDASKRVSQDEMVADAMPLARHLASRCRGQGVDDDSLESEAMLALVCAARRYRLGSYDRRTFRSWAEIWIIRALNKVVADAPTCRVAEIPRQLKRQAQKCRAAMERLALRGIRRPTTEEIAWEALLSVDDVELVQAIPGVVVAQSAAEWAEDRRIYARPDNEPTLVIAFGPQPGFSPLTTCAGVHTEARPIPQGSSICCAVCHRSGKDGHPALQRNRTTDPSPEPKAHKADPAATAKKAGAPLTRKQRRRLTWGTKIEAA